MKKEIVIFLIFAVSMVLFGGLFSFASDYLKKNKPINEEIIYSWCQNPNIKKSIDDKKFDISFIYACPIPSAIELANNKSFYNFSDIYLNGNNVKNDIYQYINIRDNPDKFISSDIRIDNIYKFIQNNPTLTIGDGLKLMHLLKKISLDNFNISISDNDKKINNASDVHTNATSDVKLVDNKIKLNNGQGTIGIQNNDLNFNPELQPNYNYAPNFENYSEHQNTSQIENEENSIEIVKTKKTSEPTKQDKK